MCRPHSNEITNEVSHQLCDCHDFMKEIFEKVHFTIFISCQKKPKVGVPSHYEASSVGQSEHIATTLSLSVAQFVSFG